MRLGDYVNLFIDIPGEGYASVGLVCYDDIGGCNS